MHFDRSAVCSLKVRLCCKPGCEIFAGTIRIGQAVQNTTRAFDGSRTLETCENSALFPCRVRLSLLTPVVVGSFRSASQRCLTPRRPQQFRSKRNRLLTFTDRFRVQHRQYVWHRKRRRHRVTARHGTDVYLAGAPNNTITYKWFSTCKTISPASQSQGSADRLFASFSSSTTEPNSRITVRSA